jgi:hypothetical protein
MTGAEGKNQGKPIRITIRYCDESELTTEERARMDAARIRLNRQVSAIIGKICREQAAAKRLGSAN